MFRNHSLTASALAGVLVIPMGLALAAEPERAQQQVQAQQQEQVIYGSQLMTPEERAAYQSRMRAAATAEERETIRKEHHEAMKLRAKERGVTLPDEPPATGGGMGPGGGRGPGGGGMGPGGGRGRGY